MTPNKNQSLEKRLRPLAYIGGLVVAIFALGAAKADALHVLVATPQANSVAISGIHKTDSAQDRRLDRLEKRGATDSTAISDIKCYVRAMAKAPGAPTVDACALREAK